MSNTLGRIDFRGRLKTVYVDIPELGGRVRLREIEARDINTIREKEGYDSFRDLAQSIIDDDGNLIYTAEDDIENLRSMGMSVYMPLLNAMQQLNLTSAKAVDDAQKKS